MTTLEQYIVLGTTIVMALVSFLGAAILLRKRIAELFKGFGKLFKKNSKYPKDLIILTISDHQFNNIIMGAADNVEQRVLLRVRNESIEKELKEEYKDELSKILNTRYQMALSEINMKISRYIDLHDINEFNLTDVQIKSITNDKITLALLESKVKADERLNDNHFEEYDDAGWLTYLPTLLDFLFNKALEEFLGRITIPEFVKKYQELIDDCEKSFKIHLKSAFDSIRKKSNECRNRIDTIKKANDKLRLELKEEFKQKNQQIIEENSNIEHKEHKDV